MAAIPGRNSDHKIATLRQIAGWSRRHLPPGVQAGARSIVHTWGKATSAVRMTPSFIVVGGQRCGTTTLYRLMSRHPQLVRPTQVKGTGYFDQHYSQGPQWYRAHFPINRPSKITFEFSGYYSFHPLAAERIGRDLPEVKLVMMIRDPVERAYSAWKHEFARGFEDQPFPTAIGLEIERLHGEEERMKKDPSYQSFSHRHHAYLGRSQYVTQIRRLQATVGRERLYVMDAGRFFSDPLTEYEALCDWLGLNPAPQLKVDRWNAREGDPLEPELQRRLRCHFVTADEELAEVLGWEPSWLIVP